MDTVASGSIASKLDDVGYSSIESWGGAIFDSCVRYLDEDPWERLRELKKAMPKTKQQMLLRGQNLVGYKHYSDEIVSKFIERSAFNGLDIFRIFDALNDLRNIKHSVEIVKKNGKHCMPRVLCNSHYGNGAFAPFANGSLVIPHLQMEF